MARDEKVFEVDYQTVTIRTIDGSTIHGRINILPRKRVSDLLKCQDGDFLVIVDASFPDCKGKTLFINKAHIIWIEPES